MKKVLAILVSIWCPILACGAANAQSSMTKNELHSFIEDIRNGTVEYDNLEGRLAKAIRKRQKKFAKDFDDVGQIEEIYFVTTETGRRGRGDIYVVRFEDGWYLFAVRTNANGRLAFLRHRPF